MCTTPPHPALAAALTAHLDLDQTAKTKVQLQTSRLPHTPHSQGCVISVELPCRRLVFSPTGPVDRDYDDLRWEEQEEQEEQEEEQ